MRWIVGGKAASGCAASASQMGRFETRWLTAEKNLSALDDLSGQWIDRVHARRPPRGVVLDMDSSVSPTHGDQRTASGTATIPAPATIRSSCSTSSATSSAAGYFYVLPFWRLASLCGYGRGMQLQNSSENATVYASWDLSEESSGESRLKARPPELGAELHAPAENLAWALLAR